jgi:hypothetical protein
MKRIAVIVVVALALVYVADFCVFQFKKSGKNPTAFGTVKVQPFYAIPHKDGKAEYMFGDPQDQPCVHALFPRSGLSPCWYIARQNGKTTSMVILPLAISMANLSGTI